MNVVSTSYRHAVVFCRDLAVRYDLQSKVSSVHSWCIIIRTLIVKICVVVNEMAEEFQHSEIHSGNPYGKWFKEYMCTVECYNWDAQQRDHTVAHLGPSKTLSLYSSLFRKVNRMLGIWGESKGKHRKHYCATSICCAYLMTAACYFLYLI